MRIAEIAYPVSIVRLLIWGTFPIRTEAIISFCCLRYGSNIAFKVRSRFAENRKSVQITSQINRLITYA